MMKKEGPFGYLKDKKHLGYLILGFKKYATFSGRATRPEFWYFMLLSTGFSVLFSMIGHFLFKDNTLAAQALSNIWALATFLPALALYCRRLHDTNRSGWWVLLCLTIVGIIPLLVFLCLKSNPNANRFGEPSDPSFQ